jgi:hypothetical protein
MSLFTSSSPAMLRSLPSSSSRIAGLALRTLIEYILSFGEDFLCPIDIFAGAACPAWDFPVNDLSPAELNEDLEEHVLCIDVLMEAESLKAG